MRVLANIITVVVIIIILFYSAVKFTEFVEGNYRKARIEKADIKVYIRVYSEDNGHLIYEGIVSNFKRFPIQSGAYFTDYGGVAQEIHGTVLMGRKKTTKEPIK